MPGQAALAGQPARCPFCGGPRLTLDDHYAVCPRLEACLPIRRRNQPSAPPAPEQPPRLHRAYSLTRRCPECGEWITNKARSCKRHRLTGQGRGRAFTIRRMK